MKNFLLLFLFLLQLTAYAGDRIYCPEALQCTALACVFEESAMAYWMPITRASETILPGDYTVSYVSAPYHAEDGGYAICVYTHTEVYQTRMLRALPDVPLVVDEDMETQWRREETWGECKPVPMDACPMRVA